VVAAYGLYLVVVGVTAVSMPAVAEGTPPGPTSMETSPVVQGLIPTVAGGLVLIGLVLRRIWLAWAGALVASPIRRTLRIWYRRGSSCRLLSRFSSSSASLPGRVRPGTGNLRVHDLRAQDGQSATLVRSATL
jgi:hypothetical protein